MISQPDPRWYKLDYMPDSRLQQMMSGNWYGAVVYIVRCYVDGWFLQQMQPLWETRDSRPQWLNDLYEPPTAEILEELRHRPFVKVGHTYGDYAERLRRLMSADNRFRTMRCHGVPTTLGPYPLMPGECVTFRGEHTLEMKLHERWKDDRIDPNREFFWVNDEMVELGLERR